MNLHHTLNRYLEEKERIQSTRGWEKPEVLHQFCLQYFGFIFDERLELIYYLQDDTRKWFVADLLALLPDFSDELLLPMLRAAVREPDLTFKNRFILPCRRVFGYEKVRAVLMDLFERGQDEEKIGALPALYWARPTVYRHYSYGAGNQEVISGEDRFWWDEATGEFLEEILEAPGFYKDLQWQDVCGRRELRTFFSAFRKTDNWELKYHIALWLPNRLEDYPAELRPQARRYLRQKAREAIPQTASELEARLNSRPPLLRRWAHWTWRLLGQKRNITLKHR